MDDQPTQRQATAIYKAISYILLSLGVVQAVRLNSVPLFSAEQFKGSKGIKGK
jgi:hypothetical protein